MAAGIIVLDKPAGMTSQQAVTRVKRMLGWKKAGHSGILDPDVTGVLPIFLGTATRLAEYVTDERKCYDATLKFGTATDTQDASGVVIASGDPSRLFVEQVRSAILSFIGPILQTPPQYSAIKVAGVRAYDLARAGKNAEIAPRMVQVYNIEMKDISLSAPEFTARFTIECGKGTYIRTICHDIGVCLGVPAHMKALVRVHSGPFSLSDAHSFGELEVMGQALVLPPEAAVMRMPAARIDASRLHMVAHGAMLLCAEDDFLGECITKLAEWPMGDLVRVHGPNGELAAIYALSERTMAGKYILRPKKVLMQVGEQS